MSVDAVALELEDLVVVVVVDLVEAVVLRPEEGLVDLDAAQADPHRFDEFFVVRF